MSGPTANSPATSGRTGSPTNDIRYLRDVINQLQDRIARLEANRAPAPLQLHQLQNASPMSQAPPGHSAVYDVNSGQIVPSPNLATLLFHMQGALATTTSPPSHARYPCFVVGVSADVSVVGTGDITFEVLKNGVVFQTVTFSGQSSGYQAPTSPEALLAYTDLITVQITAVGSNYSDLIVHVELGQVVAGAAVPIPQGA